MNKYEILNKIANTQPAGGIQLIDALPFDSNVVRLAMLCAQARDLTQEMRPGGRDFRGDRGAMRNIELGQKGLIGEILAADLTRPCKDVEIQALVSLAWTKKPDLHLNGLRFDVKTTYLTDRNVNINHRSNHNEKRPDFYLIFVVDAYLGLSDNHYENRAYIFTVPSSHVDGWLLNSKGKDPYYSHSVQNFLELVPGYADALC